MVNAGEWSRTVAALPSHTRLSIFLSLLFLSPRSIIPNDWDCSLLVRRSLWPGGHNNTIIIPHALNRWSTGQKLGLGHVIDASRIIDKFFFNRHTKNIQVTIFLEIRHMFYLLNVLEATLSFAILNKKNQLENQYTELEVVYAQTRL